MGKWKTTTGPAMARLNQAIKDCDKYQSTTGWHESAHYQDGTPVAYVASIQEFGYEEGNIPPRSYMRTTADEKSKEWAQLMASGCRRIPTGAATIRDVLEMIALRAEGDVRAKIISIYEPELAEATLKARARRRGVKVEDVDGKPLNDTGYMLATLTSNVGEKS